MEGELSVHILFNGLVPPRNYRMLLFMVDGLVYGFRPYVGYYDYQGGIDHDY